MPTTSRKPCLTECGLEGRTYCKCCRHKRSFEGPTAWLSDVATLNLYPRHPQGVQQATEHLSPGAVTRTAAAVSKRTVGRAHVVLGEGRVEDGELRDFAVEGTAGEVVGAVAQHDGAVHIDGPAAIDLEVVLRRCQGRAENAVHVQAEAL